LLAATGVGSKLPTYKKMKKIRLPEEVYLMKYHPCIITICTRESYHYFENSSFTLLCIDVLIDLATKNNLRLFAYCFMPDHVHLVIAVHGDKSIIDFVRKYKSISTIKSRKYGFQDKIYQGRFHDRFIRKEEGLNNAILYVLNNPVRKGLVKRWEDYPYSGYLMWAASLLAAAGCREQAPDLRRNDQEEN
jgi:putative transposase